MASFKNNDLECLAAAAAAAAAASANDFCYNISTEEYIRRILLLGGTIENKYNSAVNKLSPYAETFIKKQIEAGHGQKILAVIEETYISGRAPKQEMTILIHAMLCRATNVDLRINALELLKKYRTLAQLYQWKTFHADLSNEDGTKSKGYGRAVKRTINEWLLSQTAQKLAYQITKYPQRGKWGIKQMMQCAHPKTGTGDDRIFINKHVEKNAATITTCPNVRKRKKLIEPIKAATPTDLVLRYTVEGYAAMKVLAKKYNLKPTDEYNYLKAITWAKTCKDLTADATKLAYLIKIIQHYKLTREQICTEGLANLKVQTALLVDEMKTRVTMPMTALLRNLANLTRIGVFADPEILELVINHLSNQSVLEKARIHPVDVLMAWFTYMAGRSDHSKHTWYPIKKIVKVLEVMFYMTFKTMAPTGKRLCVLIDGSGSMNSPSACKVINNAEAAALIAMSIARAEANSKNPVQHSFYIFTANNTYKNSSESNTGLTDVSDLIDANASFDSVLSSMQRSDWGTTDISLGITEAMKFKRRYDAFIVITDNDVNSGIKPSEALKQYRAAMKIDAKLAVIATSGTDISIADPADKGMMDFVGFDSHAPKLVQQFISDEESYRTTPAEEAEED